MTNEMVRVNVLLLSNFLSAPQIADIKPKRCMLRTGAKSKRTPPLLFSLPSYLLAEQLFPQNYGGHLGPTKALQEESDRRVELEPNFYYP